MHYLCSEIKGADQLHGYHAAQLRLCLCICKKYFSHNAIHIYYGVISRVEELFTRFYDMAKMLTYNLANQKYKKDMCM